MIIAIDVDDVIADLMTRWLELYTEDYKDDLKPEDIESWDLTNYVKDECGDKIYSYLDKPDLLYDYIRPIKDSWSAIAQLRKKDYRIIFVTSSTISHSGRKLKWLQDWHFLENHSKFNKDYFEASDKSLIRADIIIDDRFETVQNFPGKAILFTKAWNKKEKWIYRANDWNEVLFWVEQFEKNDNLDITGVKFDIEKPRFDLLPVDPLMELAFLYTKGANKYKPRNWELGMKWGKVYRAMITHALQFWNGEDLDPEDGIKHIIKVAWNAFALAEFYKTHSELDDRPNRGK